jgi:hypothetical protein
MNHGGKMKKVEAILTEYVRRLSDDDLGFLRMRAVQNLYGDRSDIVSFVQRDRDIDRYLVGASDANEFFDMLDQLGDAIVEEYDRRDRK